MALRKSIATPFGINATVWDIARFEWNKRTGESIVALYGWKDEESMTNDLQPLDTRVLPFTFQEFPYLSVIYDTIKESKLDSDGNETNEFVGATRT